MKKNETKLPANDPVSSDGWLGIESAPMDGTKIVGWFVPNEVHAPDKAKPRVTWYEMKQLKDGTGKKLGKPFGLWCCEEGCGPMSYAPTHWVPIPNGEIKVEKGQNDET